jgi:hypothetical protein
MRRLLGERESTPLLANASPPHEEDDEDDDEDQNNCSASYVHCELLSAGLIEANLDVPRLERCVDDRTASIGVASLLRVFVNRT